MGERKETGKIVTLQVSQTSIAWNVCVGNSRLFFFSLLSFFLVILYKVKKDTDNNLKTNTFM